MDNSTVALLVFRDGAGREWQATAVVSELKLVGEHYHPPLELKSAQHFGLALTEIKAVIP